MFAKKAHIVENETAVDNRAYSPETKLSFSRSAREQALGYGFRGLSADKCLLVFGGYCFDGRCEIVCAEILLFENRKMTACCSDTTTMRNRVFDLDGDTMLGI